MDAIDPAMPRADASFLPIRTPDDYVAALDEALARLQSAVDAKRAGAQDAEAVAEEAERLADAVARSPFRMLGTRVVAKGFTPRLVAA